MLLPKKVKHRKQMKRLRRMRGLENRGCTLEFGEYGLKATEAGWITNREIEAARVAISRSLKRGGKMWIRVFPDHPLTQKPAETRMGSGKGSPEKWVAEVRPGRILYELTGVAADVAQKALKLGGAKMSINSVFVKRTETIL